MLDMETSLKTSYHRPPVYCDRGVPYRFGKNASPIFARCVPTSTSPGKNNKSIRPELRCSSEAAGMADLKALSPGGVKVRPRKGSTFRDGRQTSGGGVRISVSPQYTGQAIDTLQSAAPLSPQRKVTKTCLWRLGPQFSNTRNPAGITKTVPTGPQVPKNIEHGNSGERRLREEQPVCSDGGMFKGLLMDFKKSETRCRTRRYPATAYPKPEKVPYAPRGSCRERLLTSGPGCEYYSLRK